MRLNWGHGIAAVYTTFAIATSWFVVFAVRHPPELVSADYYARSLEHDRRQNASSRAATAGYRIDGTVRGDGRALVITIPVADTPTAITGQARLYRASDAREDRMWPLALDREGHQTLPTSDLPAGHWMLQVDWRRDGLDFYAERPVLLP